MFKLIQTVGTIIWGGIIVWFTIQFLISFFTTPYSSSDMPADCMPDYGHSALRDC